MRVLVVEDHPDVADLIARALAKDGHDVIRAAGIAEADAALASHEVEAAVLDLGLPDGNGLTWCSAVRARGHALPILVLTAQSGVGTRVVGLDAGADDFLGKPFAVAELRARVRALGRRAPMSRPLAFRLGAVTLDFTARRACVDDEEVPLTSREWSIVELLVARKGRVVSRSEIVERLWHAASATNGGSESAEGAAAASLEVLVGRIRKKLGAGLIRTVRGEGYALD